MELVPGGTVRTAGAEAEAKETERLVYESLKKVERWVEDHGYQAYEPFDGLSSPLRRLTFGNLLLERILMQSVRQSPINIRPLVGIKPLPSTKGRGYMAAGYLTMYKLTGDPEYRSKAIGCLEWLIGHKSPKFEEFSWANHFDFASRAGRYSRDESIIVWTALIGEAFVDAYETLGDKRYLDIAESVCRWILALPRERTESGTCLSYHAIEQSSIHNANMLGGAMLARAWRHAGKSEYLDVASAAMCYSCTRQQADGSWWYGEADRYRWIDNFHTGYNLDSLQRFIDSTGDRSFQDNVTRGLNFYKRHFFEDNGCPRYYHQRTHPIDSQCAAQSIETLANLSRLDPDTLTLATRVAAWTITNMQAKDGHIYYRIYPFATAKAPMLHWAQATTYRALTVLVALLRAKRSSAVRPLSNDFRAKRDNG